MFSAVINILLEILFTINCKVNSQNNFKFVAQLQKEQVQQLKYFLGLWPSAADNNINILPFLKDIRRRDTGNIASVKMKVTTGSGRRKGNGSGSTGGRGSLSSQSLYFKAIIVKIFKH